MADQFPGATKMVLSPAAQAAQAVLTEITQQEYCLDPADIPLEVCHMAYIAAALRAAASIPSASAPVPFKYKLLDIATELEGKSNEN